MSNFKVGQKVMLNPSLVTKSYLYNCYFDDSISKKLENISKGKTYEIISVDRKEHTRDGRNHNCVTLTDFGWIPEEAILTNGCDVHNFFKIGFAFKTKNGNKYLCTDTCGLSLKETSNHTEYENFSANGKHKFNSERDIVAVYAIGDSKSINSIFSRAPIWMPEKPKKEMTVAEIEKALGYSIKIVKEEEEF